MPDNPVAYVSTARLLAPPLPAPHLPRPRLHALLADVARQPLAVVAAGPGYGKSTALAAWASEQRLCWYTANDADAHLATFLRGLAATLRARVPSLPPEIGSTLRGSAGPDADDADRAEVLAALLAEAVDGAGGEPLQLVVDAAERIPPNSGGGRLLAAFVRHAPAHLHLTLATRGHAPLGGAARAGAEVTGRDLAFTEEETADLLATLGADDPEVASAVHAATGGWPAAVRLAAEAVRGRSALDVATVLERLERHRDELHSLLLQEVVGDADAARQAALRTLAALPRVTRGLCEHLGIGDAGALLADLTRLGLLLDELDADGWHALTPIAREALHAAEPLAAAEASDLARKVVDWVVAERDPAQGLELLRDLPADDVVAEFVAAHGATLVAGGACAEVAAAAAALPAGLRGPDVQLVEGHARQVLGDWEGALACFTAVAGDDGPLPAGLAWRMGLISHFRGELERALDTYGRGLDGPSERAADRAYLLGWAATAHWLRGEMARCRDLAERAATVARRDGDPGALAVTHTALALVAAADGDRRANESHYLRALAAAEEAGDVLQMLRIRCNRGSRLIEEGAYAAAIGELDLALRLAEASGYAALHGLTLCNRGEARGRLGHLEEAASDYEAARGIYQRIDSKMVSYALGGLGDVHRERGELALARAAYEEAVDVATAAGDEQGLMPALAGLARVLVADQPELAEATAARAVERSGGMTVVDARLAAGWVSLARGDHEAARVHVSVAEETARARRDRPGVAESLELGALAAAAPHKEIARLEEAASVWRALGAPIGEARAELAAAWVAADASDAPNHGEARARAAAARARLRALGVSRRAAEAAGTLREVGDLRTGRVEVQVLGTFAVRRGGDTVPHAAWQSRKARELLKVLLARRGRPVPREQLMQLLWPDEEPERLGNRLSALVSVVRGVLDPDKHDDADRYVIADRDTIGLDLRHLTCDVEGFLASASEGLAQRAADPARAQALLAEAEAAYTGDAFEEDPYEDWAMPLREEARATYVAVARALAADARSVGDADQAVRYLLRVLERDSYDERAHLDLVSALRLDGRHGEARRCYRAYAARMAELGVEAAPFASVGDRA